MKKVVFITLLTFLSVFIYSQNMNFVETENYKIYSQISWVHASETGKMLDGYFNFFNSYFHFDPALNKYKMKVKIFKDKAAFDSYLSSIIPEKKDYFVFLQYNNPEKNELVCFYSNTEEYLKFLSHYGFIHFIKTFIKNPPLWIQKGFAIYFENCKFMPETNTVEFIANTDWLYTLKKYISNTKSKTGDSIIPFSSFLTMNIKDANNNTNIFHAQSWGLVNFLLNSNSKTYNRIIWDTISALSPEAEKVTNEVNIAKKAFNWVEEYSLMQDFFNFVNINKTYPELIQDGINYYNTSDYSNAEKTFSSAISIKKDDHIPYYYLGLISYAKSDYKMAEYYYETAIQMGGVVAVNRYALGVNAYADGRYTDAIKQLALAYKSDPVNFGNKSLELILKINREQPENYMPIILAAGITQNEINSFQGVY